MKERPILFSGPMVRAILENRKTQTRRLITRLAGFGPVSEFGPTPTPGYDWHFRDRSDCWNDITNARLMAALPKVGDRFWVRESCRRFHFGSGLGRGPALARRASGGGATTPACLTLICRRSPPPRARAG